MANSIELNRSISTTTYAYLYELLELSELAQTSIGDDIRLAMKIRIDLGCEHLICVVSLFDCSKRTRNSICKKS